MGIDLNTIEEEEEEAACLRRRVQPRPPPLRLQAHLACRQGGRRPAPPDRLGFEAGALEGSSGSPGLRMHGRLNQPSHHMAPSRVGRPDPFSFSWVISSILRAISGLIWFLQSPTSPFLNSGRWRSHEGEAWDLDRRGRRKSSTQRPATNPFREGMQHAHEPSVNRRNAEPLFRSCDR